MTMKRLSPAGGGFSDFTDFNAREASRCAVCGLPDK